MWERGRERKRREIKQSPSYDRTRSDKLRCESESILRGKAAVSDSWLRLPSTLCSPIMRCLPCDPTLPRILEQKPRNTLRSEAGHLVESRRPVGSEDLLAALLGGVAVGQRELEVLGEELLEVGAADVVGLLDLDDLQDL